PNAHARVLRAPVAEELAADVNDRPPAPDSRRFAFVRYRGCGGCAGRLGGLRQSQGETRTSPTSAASGPRRSFGLVSPAVARPAPATTAGSTAVRRRRASHSRVVRTAPAPQRPFSPRWR